MVKYKMIQDHLREGQKITLAFGGEFGGIAAIQTTYLKSEPTEHYYHCPENLYGVKVYHKPKGKRRVYYSEISYITPLVVYDGWVDLDTDSIIYEDLGGGRRMSRYAMHDSRLFKELMERYPTGIIFHDIPTKG